MTDNPTSAPVGQCPVCGKDVYRASKKGPAPIYCPEHRGPSHRNRDAQAAARRVLGGAAPARPRPAEQRSAAPGPSAGEGVDAELLAQVLGVEIPPVWNAHRLAVALGLSKDPKRAAELAGLKLSDEELGALEREARAQHPHLIDFKPNAVGQILMAAFATGAVRLAANIGAIAPAALPKALSMIQQAIVGVQGSMQPAYTEMRLLVRAPTGALINMTTGEVLEPPPSPVAPAAPAPSADPPPEASA